ncbi:MAG: cytochrome c [Gammaproteobacteria bacterium]|nr:cytochrome c [Gammaproteobacteria bacterium]
MTIQILIPVMLITVLFEPVYANETKSSRWYNQLQVDKGRFIYEKNCLVCHGIKAQGITEDWKQTLEDGSYPPPPLNGSAHAWHHPLKMLIHTINNGGAPIGGKMPAFKEKLNLKEKLAVIAYFQNFWDVEKYNAWLRRGGLDF